MARMESGVVSETAAAGGRAWAGSGCRGAPVRVGADGRGGQGGAGHQFCGARVRRVHQDILELVRAPWGEGDNHSMLAIQQGDGQRRRGAAATVAGVMWRQGDGRRGGGIDTRAAAGGRDQIFTEERCR